MNPKDIFIVSLNRNADEVGTLLVDSLRDAFGKAEAGYSKEAQPLHASLEPRFFGIGGAELERAGVSVLPEKVGNASNDRSGLLEKLLKTAENRQPDAIMCVGDDEAAMSFARSIRAHLKKHVGFFLNWVPIIVRVSLTGNLSASTEKGPFDRVMVRNSDESFAGFAARISKTIVNLVENHLPDLVPHPVT